MSIALFIGYRNPRKEDRLIPIASREVFKTAWLPLCEKLRLRWVPRLQDHWRFTREDVQPVLEECRKMQCCLQDGDPADESAQHLAARLNVLVSELQTIWQDPDVMAFVGSPFNSQRRAMDFVNGDRVGNVLYDAAARGSAKRPRATVTPASRPAPVLDERPVAPGEDVREDLPASTTAGIANAVRQALTVLLRASRVKAAWRHEDAAWRSIIDGHYVPSIESD